ncbi:hypothetical protein [Mesorhizobium sp. M7A.F.Ca.US.008.03.1.1]|uniref:hypothetical protein n=1 Tax=Mesorhizobium sp. M7A.F.Ca.US.008.03.1.1 TaxID=2496742 RepID=UPI000FC9B5B4|nr:hypothetical protein [Mesorhizobium sp. M7A.F.Ca.US.008.03.1.1]RUW62772.1 hypothetical protein EOA16_06760 [Mesorhizobium sp. M7A.F.Ca.US.008.03.1.1]
MSLKYKLAGILLRLMRFLRSKRPVSLEGRNRQLEAIRKQINSEKEDWLSKLTVPPLDGDYLLVGKFIQIYAVTDFSARRVVGAMQEIALGPDKCNASTLSDKDVLEHLKRMTTEWAWGEKIKDPVLRAHRTLTMHRIHRHRFAHWVVRRFVRDDVLIVLTMNTSEAKKRNQEPHQPGHAIFGLFHTDDILPEMVKLQRHSDNLSEVAVLLENNTKRLRGISRQLPVALPRCFCRTGLVSPDGPAASWKVWRLASGSNRGFRDLPSPA